MQREDAMSHIFARERIFWNEWNEFQNRSRGKYVASSSYIRYFLLQVYDIFAVFWTDFGEFEVRLRFFCPRVKKNLFSPVVRAKNSGRSCTCDKKDVLTLDDSSWVKTKIVLIYVQDDFFLEPRKISFWGHRLESRRFFVWKQEIPVLTQDKYVSWTKQIFCKCEVKCYW